MSDWEEPLNRIANLAYCEGVEWKWTAADGWPAEPREWVGETSANNSWVADRRLARFDEDIRSESSLPGVKCDIDYAAANRCWPDPLSAEPIRNLWALFEEPNGSANLVNGPYRTIRNIRRGERHTSGQDLTESISPYDVVRIEGEITSATNITQIDHDVQFSCTECGGNGGWMMQDIMTDTIRSPSECKVCESEGTMTPNTRRQTSVQTLIVEELPDAVEDEEPADIKVTLHDDLTGVCESGERVEITGLVYPRYDKSKGRGPDKTTSTPEIIGLGVEPLSNSVDLNINEEEEERITEVVRSQDFYRRVQESWAPSLEKRDAEIRGAIATTLTRGDIPSPGEPIRGNSHLLYIGDQGSGKSKVLKRIKKLAPRGARASAGASTSKGLTASAVEDERLPQQRTLRAGLLPRCHRGVACIDELDKGDSKEYGELHDPMEDGVVRRDVAGINRSMPAKANVIAAANPKDSKFHDDVPIADQFDFPGTILDRFDLIYAVESLSMGKAGEDIADSVGQGILDAQKAADGGTTVAEEDPDMLSDEFLTKWLHLAWQLDPRHTEDSHETIKEGWLETVPDQSDLAVRELEGLYRLAKGFARLRLDETVKTIDAERALQVWRESLETWAMVEGDLDLSIKEDGLPKEETVLETAIVNLVREHEDETGEGVTLEDIYVPLVEDGHDEESVIRRVKTLSEEGGLYKPADSDTYRVNR